MTVALLCLLCAGCGDSRVISAPGMRAYELSLAVTAGHAAVAWHGGPGDHNDIYLQWLDAAGAASGPPQQLTHGPLEAYEPDLQLAGPTPVLAWYEKDAAGAMSHAWLVRLDAHGHELWRRSLSAADGAARNPVVRLAANGISVAWIETSPAQPAPGAASVPATSASAAALSEVWAARYDLAGRLLSGPVAAGPANANTWNLNGAVDADGIFHVVYDASLGSRSHELRLAIVDGTQVRNRPLSPDGIETVYPDLRFSSTGTAALTWFDERDRHDEVHFGLLAHSALEAARMPFWHRASSTRDPSFGAYLAWNGTRLAIAWCDRRSGIAQVYARSFDAEGRPLGPEHRLSHTGSTGSIPSIQPWGTGFLVAWNEYRSTGGGGHGGILSSRAVIARVE